MTTLLLLITTYIATVSAITNYANEFIDPQFLLNSSAWTAQTPNARESIPPGADFLASQGPWAVTNKTILPPSKDLKDYLSWPPYAWPDCSKAGNTTVLTDQEIWVQCKYVTRDGQFNPDQHLVNNTGAFYAMSDAIFYNTIAWRLTGFSNYSASAARLINTWFVDPATSMNPNLNYAQLLRGPGVQVGQHTGVLDLKCMTKIASAVLTLRLGASPEWTTQIDQGFTQWVSQYIVWMTNSTLAYQERTSVNNHGSFFYNQLASLYLIVNDTTNARNTVQEFFSGLYQNQIDANGEQPFEASRTHPFHYRAYNLAAVITSAKIGQYVGFNAWNLTTKQGGTIQKATDYAMTKNASTSGEPGAAPELFPVVAAVAAVYGDPSGKYKQYLENASSYEPFFFWYQLGG
ncbi:hypothetical protein BS47DRAFT_1402298 [Hydnum rufescens UP504]|uniref:Alginate lyase domain-containing protein n=1 Tax=Hydnum rufescens UP504 TaxID=1448309 RepID=A0A9P6DMH2_9AGAM|nr:hypothetical protein BS47DRAFT_1402298 [Hydnum rufescens UP504]